MIQLTKGTNVLDINLSDYSGAGQDVVQNGSFNDIGSDLVQNGDFSEIGSELVTNGDFSAVPLGSELVTYPNFTNSDISQWVMNSGRADKTWDAAEFMRLNYLKNEGQALYAVFGQTLNANYNVKLRVRGTKADGVTAQGSSFNRIGDDKTIPATSIVSNPTLTSEWQDYEFNVWSVTTVFRFYLASAEIGDLVDFDSISVKENTNLVTNPNFSATGADLLTQPIDLTADFDANSGGVIDDNNSFTTAGGSLDGLLNKVSSWNLESGKSYKLVIAGSTTSSGFTLGDGGGSGNEYGSGFGTHYFVSDGTRLWIRQNTSGTTDLTTFTIEELGEDWVSQDGDIESYNENGVTITSINTDAFNRLRQNSVTEDGKSYKVTYTIHATSYSTGTNITYFRGDTYVALPEQGVGTHTFYFTRQGTNDNWYFNLDASSSGSLTDTVTISSIIVQELGEDWTAEAGWTFGDSKALANTSGTEQLYQDIGLVNGKHYKFSYAVSDFVSGALYLSLNGNGFISPPSTSDDGNVVHYLTYSGSDGRIYFRGSPNINASITNISVKEVGQDWTVANSDSTHYVEFFGGVGGARYVSDTTSPILTLTANGITLLAGKNYKLIVDVTVVTGSVKYDVTGTTILYDTTEVKTSYFSPVSNTSLSFYRGSSNVDVTFNSISVQQLDTNNRWVTFADPDSKSVMKLGQVDLEIDSSDNNCGVYQTGLIKPNKLYIITINMKATAAINVEIAASLGTAVSAVIGTETLTTSYVEYSYEYVTPFAVAHDLQIHRLFGTGANETISIDYVSMNGVDESQWTNDPTWNPFATSLVFVPTLTDESTNNSKQFTLDTSISDGGWDGRSLHGQVIINEFPTEVPASGIINLKQPDFLEGFYQVEIRGYLGTFYRILGKCMAHLERASTEDGYNRFESYNDTVTYKAYEE